MPAALAVFVTVVAVVLGTYWLLFVRPHTLARARLRRRLRTATSPSLRIDIVKAADRFSAVAPLNAVLGRAKRLSAPLQRLLMRAGLDVTVGTLLLACGCLSLAAGLTVAWMTGSVWLAIAGALGAAFLPLLAVRYKAARRLMAFEEGFPEAIELIARALRAGHTLQTGLAMAAEEAAATVAREFRTIYDQQSFGMPLTDALRAFGDRIPLLDARFFVTAVLTQRDAGGNLAEVLDNLSAVMRDRFRVKRQIRVITAHGRITGTVLMALPPSLAFGFFVTAPGHLQLLVNDPLGVTMIGVALGLQLAGMLIIRRLVKVPY
jgi:tight adherence protein B